ncbi:MAG: hypothetical protein HY910_07710 [Desulfarculus sp.]|nr:hypothetical protein [Desulfarculus sp.]
MKSVAMVAVFLGMLMTGGLACADQYDAKWIAECINDNANANVAPEVIAKYCTCMNDKMDRNETRSITQWEKTHPMERADCDRQAGWR